MKYLITNRCVICTRVSTDNQTTDNQLIELKRVAELKGLTIIDTSTDEGISGAKGRDQRTY